MSNFEKEVLFLEQLVCNPDYFKSVMPFLKNEWFADPTTNHVFKMIKTHSEKYDASPTIEALQVTLGDDNLTEKLYDETRELLGAFSDKKQDVKPMFDQTEDYAKMRAIDIGLTQAIAIRSGENKKLSVTAIPEILEQSLAVNFNTDVGSFYFTDTGKYHDDYYGIGKIKYPFAIKQLNEFTNGGVSDETLNVVLAGINTGKTTWLLHQCCEKVLQGHNSLYISLEVGKNVIRERADVIMLDTIFGEAEKMKKDEYVEKLAIIHDKCKAEMVIHEYPDGMASVAHFKMLLRELKIQHNFIPKFVFIDYITNAASESLEPSVKSNSNLYYGVVAQEFRAFAKVYDLVVWTAAQLTRSKQTSDDANLADIGLAITISGIADFMLFLGAPEQLVDQNMAVARILKNRYGHLKPKFLVGANQQKQSYYGVDNVKTSMNKPPKQEPFKSAGQAPAFKPKTTQPQTKTEGSGDMTGWKF